MAAVRSKGTKPEMIVRRSLHRLGYRYRLHRADLPGSPDLVFVSRRKALFVNGCFWHAHEGCARARVPESNRDFWSRKLERNRVRDIKSLQSLDELGWSVLTVWECELRDFDSALAKVLLFLGPPGPCKACL